MSEKTTVAPAQYLQIALDLASRIAAGELEEGYRLYGRSVMASEYAVSPETIRRALRLLADMKVVQVLPQSGTVVLSADSARRYLDNFGDGAEAQTLRRKLQGLIGRYDELNRETADVVRALLQARDTFAAAKEPLPNYEVAVPENSPVVGRSIGSLRFWQSTGGTIVAIRRAQHVILSPGPYAELYGGDVVILVGSPAAAQAAARLVEEKEVQP